MRTRTLLGATLLALVASMLAASGAGAGKLPQHSYVAQTVQLPTTNVEALAFGRDLGGSSARDNAFGKVFALLASVGINFAGSNAAAVAAGDIVVLHTLRTTSLRRSKAATWQLRYGEPVENPDLTGGGTFQIASWLPNSGRVAATIKEHHVRTKPAPIPLQLSFGPGWTPYTLDLVKGRIFATCTRAGCTAGRINGAVPLDQIETVFIPALVEMIAPIIVRDCPAGPDSCASPSDGQTYLSLFDVDHDGVVTTEEVSGNELVGSLLAPDLDLFGHDKVKDSLSFGVGFTAVKATVTR